MVYFFMGWAGLKPRFCNIQISCDGQNEGNRGHPQVPKPIVKGILVRWKFNIANS